MLRRFIFVLVMGFAVIVNNISIYPQEKDKLLENTILWKISRKDLSFDSYLIGTHHFIPASYIDTSKIIAGILKKVNTFVIESDTADIDLNYVTQVMKMKDDEYYAFSRDEDRKMLDTCIKEIMGVFIPYYDLKPMGLLIILQFLLTNQIKINEINTNFVNIDNYFKAQGEKTANRLITLETPEEQLALLFDSISIKRQTEYLMTFVKAYNLTPNSVRMIDTCYKIQNLYCIYQIVTKGYNEQEIEMLLSRRNHKWMTQIPNIINENPSIIAVGAGHLVGSFGLIRLLRNAGYIVSPIQFY